ncbi:Conserved virulence factor B [uncultured Roseburia sp.]|uniref:S1-like domain-containing RNA-binding protein n=1 Tax=Brotonthovivens ammoniilytica TaxID=2981725 RepID=A0ABT2TM06_9FIRM|nr:S1-like domain-containing RNA-binding protein [Brotonthovivens ammoniilytica]MCU6763253.1 S1-like domain-containing RNA-binding protein [Brotonthovivens ammoniilytica]SCJ10913.1 Conserved virulence factor B [uncultured Roseburia sp.]
MLHLGEKQSLTVVKTVDFGIYLAENQESQERVLLPKKQVPEGIKLHDTIEVFLYKDSKDRLIATTAEPALLLNEFAVLTVSQVSHIGAFLNWGLEKDLFLPYKEQLAKVKEGDQVLVTLYIDKSRRLCASMRGLYHLLKTDSPYQKGDLVQGRVYEFSDNFGAFIAVDDCYSARIPSHEDHTAIHIGQMIEAKVTNVKPDGKLDLTLREKAHIQMDKDAQRILNIIDQYAGVLPFNDKASPEIIQRETQLSKNAFKRAVGRLYKERKIIITEKSIRRIDK